MVDGSMGVGSDRDRWVWIGRLVVGGLGYGWVSLWVPIDGSAVGG